MQEFKNISIFNDDLEIIDVLQDLPPSEEFENMNILRFIQEKTIDNNFGWKYRFNNKVYTIYKFDKKFFGSNDAGLIMTMSDDKHAASQVYVWENFRESGMQISSKIFDMFDQYLSGFHFVQKFYSNTKK